MVKFSIVDQQDKLSVSDNINTSNEDQFLNGVVDLFNGLKSNSVRVQRHKNAVYIGTMNALGLYTTLPVTGTILTGYMAPGWHKIVYNPMVTIGAVLASSPTFKFLDDVLFLLHGLAWSQMAEHNLGDITFKDIIKKVEFRPWSLYFEVKDAYTNHIGIRSNDVVLVGDTMYYANGNNDYWGDNVAGKRLEVIDARFYAIELAT